MSRDQKLKMKEIGKLVAHSCFMILIFEEDSEKKSESQMGFEPTTLRDLVGCSNHLSYWRLYGEQGPICGSPLEPHHAATHSSNDWHTRTH